MVTLISYRLRQFSIILFLLLISNTIFSAPNILVSEEKVKEKMQAVENINEIGDGNKDSLLKLYYKTLSNLDSIKANDDQFNLYAKARKEAPAETKRLAVKLEIMKQKSEKNKLSYKANQNKPTEEILTEISNDKLIDIERRLNSESANLAAVAAKKSDFEQSINSKSESSSEIRKQLVESNHKLEELRESRKIPLSSQSADLKIAAQWALDTHIEVLRTRIKMLDKQLLSQNVRLDLLKIKKEIVVLNLNNIKYRVNTLKRQVDLKRNAEMQKNQEITRTEQDASAGKHPLIQSLAKKNSQLSESIIRITKELIRLEENNDKVINQIQQLKAQKSSTQKKLDIAGLNQILGQILWKEKQGLPDSTFYKKQLRNRQKLLANRGLEHIHYQEELKQIKENDNYLQSLMNTIPVDIQTQINDDLIQLIKTRKGLLVKASSIDSKYLKVITELEFSEKKLIATANSYSLLLDEHLFWLRSASLLNIENFFDLPDQIRLLLIPSKWFVFFKDFVNMSLSSPIVLISFMLFFILLMLNKRIHKRVIRSGRKTKKISTDRLLHTWKAIFFTLLLAAPLPIFLHFSGIELKHSPESSSFTHVVAGGILIIALPLFSLQVFRYMCLPGGLFEVHFKWSIDVINGLKKEVARLTVTFIPIIFITAMLISEGESNMNGGLGRLFLLFTLATFALFFYRLLKPHNGLLSSVVKHNQQTFFARYQAYILFIGLLLAGVLMCLTIVGYVYTSAQLTSRLIYTVWFIFSIVVLQQVSVRWLLITQRKYALQKAIEKHQSARIQKNENLIAEDSDDTASILEYEEPEIDIISLSEESRKLLNLALFIFALSGLWFIWSDVLPALIIFEKIVLWHHEGVIDGAKKLLPVTLGDLGLATVIAIASIIAARRLPVIVEILLLNSVSRGNRYTVTTLVNYSIIGVGLFSIFNILGADWARFQWLFAALGVGIGFGLQEIVANFISGIIILFERPIRVGDTVSVGGNDGIVTKIRIRATTILTFDRKELLVPNKEFITGQLLNWTFSDQSSRLTLPIGIAYGSDIPQAKALLLEAANENERVLNDPAANVVFVEFGDNTLNLHLRCYIDNIENRMRVTSAINESINEKFTKANISIAFPQRDIHLDINRPVDIRLHK